MTLRFSDELISAYLDGELTAQEQEYVEEQLRDNVELRRMCDELRSLRVTLQAMPVASPPENLAERVLRQAERRMLVGDRQPAEGLTATDAAPISLPAAPRSHRSWRLAAVVAVALAASVLAVLCLPVLPWRGTRDVAQGPTAAPGAMSPDTAVVELQAAPAPAAPGSPAPEAPQTAPVTGTVPADKAWPYGAYGESGEHGGVGAREETPSLSRRVMPPPAQPSTDAPSDPATTAATRGAAPPPGARPSGGGMGGMPGAGMPDGNAAGLGSGGMGGMGGPGGATAGAGGGSGFGAAGPAGPDHRYAVPRPLQRDDTAESAPAESLGRSNPAAAGRKQRRGRAAGETFDAAGAMTPTPPGGEGAAEMPATAGAATADNAPARAAGDQMQPTPPHTLDFGYGPRANEQQVEQLLAQLSQDQGLLVKIQVPRRELADSFDMSLWSDRLGLLISPPKDTERLEEPYDQKTAGITVERLPAMTQPLEGGEPANEHLVIINGSATRLRQTLQDLAAQPGISIEPAASEQLEAVHRLFAELSDTVRQHAETHVELADGDLAKENKGKSKGADRDEAAAKPRTEGAVPPDAAVREELGEASKSKPRPAAPENTQAAGSALQGKMPAAGQEGRHGVPLGKADGRQAASEGAAKEETAADALPPVTTVYVYFRLLPQTEPAAPAEHPNR
jgi:hypothetical protein